MHPLLHVALEVEEVVLLGAEAGLLKAVGQDEVDAALSSTGIGTLIPLSLGTGVGSCRRGQRISEIGYNFLTQKFITALNYL